MLASPRLYQSRQICKVQLALSGWTVQFIPEQQQQHRLNSQKLGRKSLEKAGAGPKLEALKYAIRRSSSSFTPQQTLQAVALPPDDVPALGPRVEHIIAKDAGTLSAILSSQLLLPEASPTCHM